MLMGFTCCEVGTFWDNAELPSFFRVSSVTPGPGLSIRISTVVVVALTSKAMSMRRLEGPLLAGSPRNSHTCFPLVICTKRAASLTSKFVWIKKSHQMVLTKLRQMLHQVDWIGLGGLC